MTNTDRIRTDRIRNIANEYRDAALIARIEGRNADAARYEALAARNYAEVARREDEAVAR